MRGEHLLRLLSFLAFGIVMVAVTASAFSLPLPPSNLEAEIVSQLILDLLGGIILRMKMDS